MPTTSQLLDLATVLEEEAAALGDAPLARRLRAYAALARSWAAEGLPPAERSANVDEMTSAQIARRGRGRARVAAEKSADPRRVAIAARWGSLRRAAKAARISPAALVGYLDGEWPCPRRVARFFAADPALPADERTWRKGVVD